VRSATEGHGQGSDHRPIIAELVLGRALQRPAAWSGLRLVTGGGTGADGDAG
jgi:hypothetical protein